MKALVHTHKPLVCAARFARSVLFEAGSEVAEAGLELLPYSRPSAGI